jgi:hypothetical protein
MYKVVYQLNDIEKASYVSWRQQRLPRTSETLGISEVTQE